MLSVKKHTFFLLNDFFKKNGSMSIVVVIGKSGRDLTVLNIFTSLLYYASVGKWNIVKDVH
jgi:hypothetical protein